MSFEAAVHFLFDLEKFGMKMDLQNIKALMKFAGNPHERLKTIHVAGTNGKGSTCAMIASVLSSMGYKVGLYTSPHIVSFTERIKISGEPILEEEVIRLTELFEPEITRLRATFFEATTAMMFKHFENNKVDFAVIETGLGGRLDATNIVDPLISIITGISYDHTEILGDTLEKIAFEKAGIIKPNRPAVVNIKLESLKKVFRKAGNAQGADVFFVDENSSYSNVMIDIDSSVFDANIFGPTGTQSLINYPRLQVGLVGEHQIQNSLTALVVLHVLSNTARVEDTPALQIDRRAIYRGYERIEENTGHRGRLEIMSREPLIVLDVAHNSDGIHAVMESLSALDGYLRTRVGVLLFGAMRDKDVKSMLDSLRERFGIVILTSLQNKRSLTLEELKNLSDNIKLNAKVFGNSIDALRAALTQTNDKSFLLITGSHYLAGEVVPHVAKLLSVDSMRHGTGHSTERIDDESYVARSICK